MKWSSRKIRLPLFVLIFLFVFSNLFSYSTFAAKRDTKAPTAPSNLRTVTVTENSISLQWNASKDNGKSITYNIYKDGVAIGSSTLTKYTVNGLSAGTTYKFFVSAKDAAGNTSASSKTLSVTTLRPVTPAPPTTTPEPSPVPPEVTPTPDPEPTPPESTPTPSTNKVVGYYAAWSAYSGYTPDKIDATKLTHINYAFANVTSDLKVTLGYPDIDALNISKLNALKQTNPNLKTLISIGGWSWSGKFSNAALTEASRTTFANSCVDFIVKYGFDGVDIDWEYPVSGGLSTNTKRPEDKQNFTLLLKTIREKLDSRGLQDGKHYLLTIAGGSGSWYLNNIELSNLQQYLDYANVMTYDIHGSWDSYTDFNAPLYNNNDSSPQYKWSVDSSVNAWLKAGIPANKLVVGVPFYGYVYNSVNNTNNGLYQRFSSGSSISYSNIVSKHLNTPGYVRYFHQQSMVPWLYNGSTFISYEDEQSIGLKAEYIKSKGLGGAAIWELSQDSKGTLLNALNKGIQ